MVPSPPRKARAAPLPDERVLRMFSPRSIAVLGAGRDPRNLGRQVLDRLVEGQFRGAVYPVNPNAQELAGRQCFPSVRAVPGPVDLAVVAVPAAAVPDAIRDCAAHGVKSLVIITAGFRESGPEGAKLEAEVAELLRTNGMRAIGPNCMGVLNTDPAVSMNATFAPELPPRGNVAFVSQSGALGIAILARARDWGLGLHAFASLGNKTNLSTNDLLEAWENDPNVGVILLYLENFGNPRKFLRLARRITPTKPIVAIKSGRTSAGQHAAQSHTGALAEPDSAATALFSQSGVHRANSMEEMFDIARALARAPLPKGRRVAILTNSGGPGILAADAALTADLTLATPSAQTIARVREVLGEHFVVGNPLDLLAGASPQAYDAALQALLADEGVDACIAIYTPPIVKEEEAVLRVIQRHGKNGKPLLAVVLGRETRSRPFEPLREAGVPVYEFPENAVRALSALCRQSEHARRAPEAPPRVESVDRNAARALVGNREGWLTTQESLRLLDAYGIPTVATRRARTVEDARAAARDMGFPVVLKAESSTLLHKSDVGGVALDIRTDEQLAAAFQAMRDDLASAGHTLEAVLVQRMAPSGVEILLGSATDPKFGPILVVGAGGTRAELMRDTAQRLAPITRTEARQMIESLRIRSLLLAHRGRAARDEAAVEDALLRLSQLVDENPEIAELDVNPLVVLESGALAVDARVRVDPVGARAAAVPADLAAGEGK